MGKQSDSNVLRRAVWLALGVASLGVAWVVSIVVEHVRYERATFRPERKASVRPSQAPFDRLGEVTFQYKDATVAAWYAAPTTHQVVVVIAHGSMGRRDQMLPEIGAVLRTGAGVMVFDFPGHGDSDGVVDIFEQPRVVSAVVDRVKRETTARVVALGFSMGGYAVIAAAQSDARIEGLITLGAFSDAYEQTMYEHQKRGWLSQMAAVQTCAWYGLDLRRLRPIDFVPMQPPRPWLIGHGSLDPIVPLAQGRELFEKAADPKEFWVIEGAGHGHYGEVIGEGFDARLAEFLNRRMLQAP